MSTLPVTNHGNEDKLNTVMIRDNKDSLNALIELWDDYTFMAEGLDVVVVSEDGWTWLLSWLQVGVQQITCIAIGERALKQLEHLEQSSLFGKRIQQKNRNGTDETTINLGILCLHVTSIDFLEDSQVRELLSSSGGSSGLIPFVTLSSNRALKNEVTKRFPHVQHWQTLRHSALGGLTTARMMVGWDPTLEDVYPGKIRYPQRPLGRFLEPAARLAQWRNVIVGTSDCWTPHRDGTGPYPWPWKTGPQWVETHTVYFNKTVQRHFTKKEKCQLLDLRCQWMPILEEYMLWQNGAACPLRMYIEFITAARFSLQQRVSQKTGKEMKTKRNFNDWGRNRAPWVALESQDNPPSINERIKYFGWNWDPDDLVEISKACRGDDAEINLALWAVGGNDAGLEYARGIIRTFLWRCWIKRLVREALQWLRQNITQENVIAIRDCVKRCALSDWWTWEHGSRLLFWRWPPVWINEARDGSPGFHFKQPRPQLRFPQVPLKEEWIILKDKEKLEKLLRRGYIVKGRCRVTVPRFPVPKGDDDIRVVWDLAKNGVNETMYTPTFFLATMSTYLRRVEPGIYGGDFDVGEQFHNYCLHPSEQPYCGVEIPDELLLKLSNEGIPVDKFMRWGRLVFGWQSSPYMALRMFARAIEIAKGDPTDTKNAFAWEAVALNLPGSLEYNPALPRVRKITLNGDLAADLVTFYDDGRVFGPDEVTACRAIRQMTAKLQWLGNQDAARKRRAVSQRPGAWAGGIAYSDQGLLRVFVDPKKWEKAKEFLHWVWDSIEKGNGLLERKRFRSGKGFLVHMSTCYEYIQPYLKGFHLSEDAWRADRDSEGWKVPNLPPLENVENSVNEDESETFLMEGYYDTPDAVHLLKSFPITAPPLIVPVPRLKEDVRILIRFFQPSIPVQIIVRPVEGSMFVAYGGGDASGEGFGAQIQPLGMKPLLRRGFWSGGDSEHSSNWRELRNLVDSIREEAAVGRLVGREIWMATDNSTAANAFYKGTSSSKLLHEMITELRELTILGNFILRLYHIAGTRMIASGIDGLSRGELDIESLSKAIRMLMPLDQSPIERSPLLVGWLQTWLGTDFSIAETKSWFHAAQLSGQYISEQPIETWVWDLHPAAALHAIEELGMGRLKRHELLKGVVLIPTLMEHEWFRRFSRVVDFYFTIPPGAIPSWPVDMHESLTVGIYLPLFRCRPWDWKCVPFLVQFESSLSSLYKTNNPEGGNFLRQFWISSSRITYLPKRLVSDVLQGTSWRKFLCLSGER